jgi:hypothetical protein
MLVLGGSHMFVLISGIAPLGVALIVGMVFSVFCFLVVLMVFDKRNREDKRERADISLAANQQQLLQKQQQLMAEYSKEYEQRKLTIGTIKCSQCEWSGQWGTGMTYEQFFAGNLAEAGIDVARRDVNNDNLSSDNRQYTCPVCNSSGWKKA